MLEQTLGLLMTAGFFVSFLPQIIKSVQTKSTEDISYLFLILYTFSNFCGIAYTACQKELFLWWMISYISGAFMGMFLVLLKFFNDDK